MDLFNVITIDEAKRIVKDNFQHNDSCETVDLMNSYNRICGEDIKSSCNVPNFRKSIVDGYAVKSGDICGATETNPIIIQLVGEVFMGDNYLNNNIKSGECVYVPTGGMVPGGFDSVIKIEYTEKLGEDTILIYSTAASGENVIEVGEDISKKDIAVKRGTKIRPYEIGLLAGIGVTRIPVFKKMKVGIISTGDELISYKEEMKQGKVRDINTYLLQSLVIKDEMIPVTYGIIKDDYEKLHEVLDKALLECDLVLISGGSSVGKKDHTLKLLDSYDDSKILCHGISVKPGKPTIIAKKGDKVIFGLPGHPLACSVIYSAIVKEYINMRMNYEEKQYGINAIMKINYHKAKGREEFLPVKIEEKGNNIYADPIFGKSDLMTSFSKAWGYIRIDKNVEGIREGSNVKVYSF